MKKNGACDSGEKPQAGIKSPAKKANTQAHHSGSINNNLSRFLQMLPEKKEAMFQFLDMFPLPIEIFAPDGSSIFLNRAYMKLNNITNMDLVTQNYNLLNDPVCMDQMGLREGIQRVFFSGEAYSCFDVEAPMQDMVNRGVITEKPFEKSLMDWYLYPVKSNGKLAFVVFIVIVKKLYHGRPDVARAREYIDTHWLEEYDPRALAQYVNISVNQLYHIFKKDIAMTPGDYYRKCKVEHITQTLADKSLSIKEIFAACGADSRGAYAKIFKKLTGLSPNEYRKHMH